MLYHMAKQNIYDPEFFTLMEKGLKLHQQADLTDLNKVRGEKNVTARHAMGAVCAYWKTNLG